VNLLKDKDHKMSADDLRIRRSYRMNLSVQEQFILAISDGDLDTVKKFIHDGMDVNADDNYNRIPLTRACMSCQPSRKDIIIELLKAGADVNKVDREGQTAISVASMFFSSEVVQVLIDVGANVNYQCRKSMRTPLIFASGNDLSPKIVRILLKAGADIYIKDKWERNVYNYAGPIVEKILNSYQYFLSIYVMLININSSPMNRKGRKHTGLARDLHSKLIEMLY
jgi:ankyrin repeat protein